MSKKIKIRAFLKKDITKIKAILAHPMETGLRKNKKTGKPVSAHFITEVKTLINDETVLTCFWGAGISKNPFLSFDLKGAKVGDNIKITWIDNKGESSSGEIKLA